MKKIIPVILVITLLLCGCKNGKIDETTDAVTTTQKDSSQTSAPTEAESESTDTASEADTAAEADSTSESPTTQTPPESTTVRTGTVSAISTSRCIFGEKSETAGTLTGLMPLGLNTFSGVDFSDKGLSNATKEHSFGVAKDEQVHHISTDTQNYFDENNFDAVCYDNKTDEKVLYLTFDCGYENGYTSVILDTLRDKNVKASFFCTLPQVKQNGELIARMINEGHIVGNHSVTHPDFSSLSRQEMFDELKGFDDYLRQNFGYSAFYFRYPQGKYSENSLDLINSMGYKCVFWSVAYVDWDLDNQKGAAYALQTVSERLHPGAVILLHSVSPDNANALADIIDSAKNRGYVFRSLEELN